MEVTVSAKAEAARAHITAGLPNGFDADLSAIVGGRNMKRVLVLLGLSVLAVSLYAQVSTRGSYQQLKDENEELRSQLAEIHSEAEDAQSEVDTLKSDVEGVQSAAIDCSDCDDVESVASDLDTPIQSLD